MIRVFLCVKDFSILKQMMEFDNGKTAIKIVGISTTVLEDLNELESMHVDILVLQFSIDKEKASKLLSYIVMEDSLKEMKVLSLFKDLDSDIIHLLLKYNIQNFLTEPYTFDQLTKAIESEYRKKEIITSSALSKEAKASQILMEIGIPTHLLGYSYIKTAALIIAHNCIGVRVVMGKTYNEVARIHHSTSTRVEKAIRASITYALRTQPHRICIYHTKPTSSQIILYVSEKLKLFETK